MSALILFQKSAPNLIDLFLPLLGTLLIIFAFNSLYEWLKTKPWKKNPTPPLLENPDQTKIDEPNEPADTTNLHNDSVLYPRPV
jgi:hypothetical protein